MIIVVKEGKEMTEINNQVGRKREKDVTEAR